MKTKGMALTVPGGRWEPYAFERRTLRPDDLAVRVTWCGLCHSDLHAAEALTAGAGPLVPGHEFTGEVTAVGSEVTGFRVGDPVAVGNIVDSCGVCPACRSGAEQFCREFPTTTYGGKDRVDGSVTLGAYSRDYVVRESFAYPLPPGLDPAGVAPLMCAGATVFEPLRRWDVGPGQLVGVVGLGGLGHLAVKFAKALGARVAVFTTSPGKEAAARDLGADEVIISGDGEAMAAQGDRFDFMLDTASAKHDPSPYLRALRMDGTLCMLGIPDRYEPEAMALLYGFKRLAASGSAGRSRTREMLDFAARHHIVADVEKVPARDVGPALDRLARNDVRWRFVLDLADLD
ncbi:NAD(P)-dependent alcohol dehydrogenase [Actinoplanes sp. Pm04-4]|uniref:alcohol dehydrogenase (NADP(+)) n=1 Tax=Paractinoplanes pyxinae TaxID=2997416 RepID=A0ABT4AXR9_9ACTN|nr:NAD(P)-dependent alcohol dehydrogenase [Actinoplanes pyxinae]MCY1139021.1 NAD(P)-dependent alcohol dehydrogenase [Actinoplanes pyxinae]